MRQRTLSFHDARPVTMAFLLVLALSVVVTLASALAVLR